MRKAAHLISLSRRTWCAVLALCTGLMSAFPIDTATAKPERIASIYLCSDQLLLQLADRDRIVSLNRFAADPSFSNEVEASRGIPLNRGRAEEILPLQPDLVIAGAFTAPATKAMLRRVGIPVLELPVETSFADIRRNIRRVATALGEETRGRALIEKFDAGLTALPPPAKQNPSLMLFRFGGYSQGSHTLSDAIFTRAGFANYAATRVDGVGRLSLERIVADPPDAIVLSETGADRNSLTAEALAHPALRDLRNRIPTTTLPDRLWICGLGNSVDAVRRLAEFRRKHFQAATHNEPGRP
jgi:iron complex transport system substrate-binding protein